MKNPVVTIEMESGDVIKAELYPEVAPNTVNNFISLVKGGFYDGLIFHRVISGFMMPWGTATNCAYFTIRSGGRTFITFLFDCVFNWAVCLPLAYVLCYHTAIGVAGAFLLVQCADLLKCFIGMAMLKSGIWAKNVVNG